MCPKVCNMSQESPTSSVTQIEYALNFCRLCLKEEELIVDKILSPEEIEEVFNVRVLLSLSYISSDSIAKGD